MFGSTLHRFFEWLGFWQVFAAVYALLGGVFAGAMWRTSPVHQRRIEERAARHPKLCRDCQWAAPESTRLASDETAGWRHARCMHPSARLKPERYLVLGIDEPDNMAPCEWARNSTLGKCGPLAKFWKPGPQLIAPAQQGGLGKRLVSH
jgi:hypothetical protein